MRVPAQIGDQQRTPVGGHVTHDPFGGDHGPGLGLRIGSQGRQPGKLAPNGIMEEDGTVGHLQQFLGGFQEKTAHLFKVLLLPGLLP